MHFERFRVPDPAGNYALEPSRVLRLFRHHGLGPGDSRRTSRVRAQCERHAVADIASGDRAGGVRARMAARNAGAAGRLQRRHYRLRIDGEPACDCSREGCAPKAESRVRTLDPYALAAIRLLILTGARLREILDAQWQHVDIERGVIFLADSKTGRKPIYLSAAAQAVLAALPRIAGNPHIIPGEQADSPRADLKRPWAAVTKAAGIEGVRLHDLRHSFASIGAG